MPIDEKARAELEIVYRRTNYAVDDIDPDVTIRLDRDNPSLRAYLEAQGAGSWAFLTAYNPYSQSLPESENLERQDRLIRLLQDEGYRYYRGRGVGDDWEEPSLFIVNITRGDAITIGKDFEQNAILWGEAGGEPELIWCG